MLLTTRCLPALLLVLNVVLMAASLQAANQIWDGGSLLNGNWSTITNWSGDTAAPGSTSVTNSTDVATFNVAIANGWGLSATPIIIDSTTQNISGLSFTGAAGNYFIGTTGGNALKLSSGGSIQILAGLTATNAIETINAPLALHGTTYTFANNSVNGGGAGSGTLVFGGGITGVTGASVLTLSGTNTNANTIGGIMGDGTATSLAITKSGAGTWVLSNANTYTGVTLVNAGVLNIRHASALGSTAGGTSVLSGAALQLQGGITILAEALTLNGTGISSTGALRNISGDNDYAGLITLGSATRINSNADTLTLSHSGTITGNTFGLTVGGAGNTIIQSSIGTGTGTLTKDGAGTLTLAGANTYTGATTVSGGTLKLGGSNALGSNPVVSLSNTTGVTLDLAGFNTQVSSLSGGGSSGGNVLLGAATLTVADTLFPTFAGVISGAGGLTKTGTSTLTLSGANTYTGTTTISAGTLTLGSSGTTGSLSASSAITNNGTLAFHRNDTVTQGIDFANVISGTGAVTQSGSGTLVLSGANTYSGLTTVSGGALNIRDASALGSVAGGTSVSSGAALQLQGGITTLAEPLTLNGTGIGSSGALRNVSGDNTYTGLITLGNSVPARINSDAGTLTLSYNGTIAASIFNLTVGGAGNTTIQSVLGVGSTGLVKDGAGTLTLTRANAYTGTTTVSGGTLVLAFGTVSSNILSSSSPLTLDGGTLQLTGTGTQTVNGLSTNSTGSRIVLGASQTLTLGAWSSPVGSSALNFNTAAGGANGATVGSGVVVLTGQTAGNAINAGFTVTDAGGFGLATVNGSNRVVRLTTTTLLPATGASSATNYRIDNNNGGAAVAGSVALAITSSEAALSLTVDTTAASGAVTLASGVVLSINIWNFGSSAASSNGWQIGNANGAAAGTGIQTVASSNTIDINNYNTGVVTFNAPIMANGINVVNVMGTGTTVFGGANTYTNGTNVRGGTLEVAVGGSITHTGTAMTVANLSGENGTLNITGGTVSSSSGMLGSEGGSSGTVTVSGGSWTNNAGLIIGNSGIGMLNISGGSVISNTTGMLGSSAGSSGTVTVSGGSWSSGSTLFIGFGGTGVLNITAGSVSNASGVVGNNSGGSGTVTVSGGAWTNGSNTLDIGYSGTGVMTINGGTVSNTTGTLGSDSGSSGTVTVSNGSWTNDGELRVGFQGTGVLNISGGAVSNTTGTLGSNAGSSGTATVSGGTWTNTGSLTVGRSDIGVLNISGGSVSSAGGTIGSSGNGTVTVSSGSWVNSGTFIVGSIGSGVMIISGGSLSSAGGTIGSSVGGGTATVSGGSWTSSGGLTVGSNGTGVLNITGSGAISNTVGTLGSNASGSGTATVSGGTWTNSGSLTVGSSGTGVLNLTGGAVHAGGVAGTGTVTLGSSAGSTGTLNVGTGGAAGTLNAANVNGGSGTAVVNFNHTGSLSFAPTLTGSLAVNQLGSGTTTLTSASTHTGATTISVGTLQLGQASALQNSTVTLATANGLTFSSGIGTFTVGGLTGTSDELLADVGAAAITLNVDGNGSTYGGGLSGGGSLGKTGAGNFTLSGVNTYTGATAVTGGVLKVNGSTAAASAVGVSGGALGGTGTVGGTVTLSGGGGIKLMDGAVGTLTLSSTLAISGAAGANPLFFDLGAAAAGTDKLAVGGATSVTTAGAAVIALNQIGGTATRINAGTYTLIQGTGSMAPAGQFTLATTAAFGSTYVLSVSGNNLQVTTTQAAAGPAAAFWQGGNTNWSTAGNWNTSATSGTGTGAAPGYQSNVTFATTTPVATNLTTNVLDVDFDINSLTFNAVAGGVTIGGTKMLTLEATAGTGITASNSSGTNTISAKVGLAANQTWTVASGGTLAVSGAVSDFGGGYTLTKAGPGGTLVLSGANTYSGLTTVSAGVLNIRHASALGDVAAGTIVTSGAALQLQDGIITLAEALTLNGTGISTTGALRNISGDNTYAGLITLGSATRINSDAGTLTLSHTGTITGTFGLTVGGAGNTTIQSTIGTTTGTLTKDGTGTLTLSSASTYTGATAVNGGTLVLAFGTVTGNLIASGSALTLGGGTLQLTGTGTQIVNGLSTNGGTGSRIVLGASQTLTLGTLSAGGSSALNFNTAVGGANATTTTVGSGLIVLIGQTAGSVINAGFTVTDNGGFGLATVNGSNQVVRLTTTTLLPVSTAVVGTDYLIDNNNGGTAAAGSSALIITTTESANSITVDTSARNGVVTLNSTVVLSNNVWNFGGNGSNTWSVSNASGAAAGTGLMTVASGNGIEINNYAAGVITFSAPILAFGSNAVNVKGMGTTVFAAVNTYTGGTVVRGGTLEVASGGSITHTGASMIVGSLSGDSGTLNLTGGAVGNATGAIGNGSASSSGVVTVSGGSWTNTGSLTIGNFGTGMLTISGGTVHVGGVAGTGTATLGSFAGSSGTLNLGSGGTAGTLNAATVTSGSGTTVVNFNHTGTLTFTPTLTGSLPVNKLGAGTTVLTKTNTYTGATTIGAGTLQLGNGGTTGSLATSSVITNHGTLAFNRSNTVTQGTDFASVISGSGGVTQMGSGILVLSGVNTYTGATVVTGGVLQISGSTAAASAVSVSGGALGSGTVNGTVTLSSVGGIKLTDAAVGTLTLGSTLAITGVAGANNLYFDLASAGTTTDKIVVAGAVTVTTAGAAVVSLNQLGGVANRLTAGTYDLITGSAVAASGSFSLATTRAFGQTFALTGTATQLQLITTQVTATTAAAFWKGGANNWSTAANWNSTVAGGGAAAGAPDYQTNVTFATTTPVATNLTTNVVDVDFDINSLTFNGTAGGVTVGGTKLLTLEASNANGNTAGNGITSSNSSGTNTITANMGLAASQTWTVASGGTLAVSGVVSDFGGGYTLTKAGVGTLVLSGANSYSGVTTVSAGVLNLQHGSGLGTTDAGTSVASGAALQLQGGITTLAEALTLNGSGIATDGALRNLSGDNTYAGLLNLDSGTRINSDTGTLTLSHNGTVTGIGFGLTVGGAGNTAVQSVLGTGIGTLTKDGAGTLTLFNTNTYTGATTLNGGTLKAGANHALGINSAVTLANTAGVTLDLNGFNVQIASLSGGGASGGNVMLGTGTLTVAGPLSAQPFAGVISGSGGSLIQSGGTSTLILTGTNTFTGITTISAGTLQLGNGGTTGSLSANGALTNNATLIFNRSNSVTQGTDFASVISGSGAVRQNGLGTLTFSGANAYTGATAVNGGTLVLAFGPVSSNIIASSSALTLGGSLLQLTGSGTQTFGGLTTTASTGNRILLGSNQTLTLGALTLAGARSALNFNTAAGGANGATVGSGVVVLTGQTAGNAINAGFTVTDSGGFGLATVNGANQVVRLTTTTLLPASGATSGINYRIDNNAGGATAAGSSALAITASEAALSLTVDTTAASGAVTLASGVVLSTNTWNFGGTGSNTWQISGSTGGAGLKAGVSGNAIEINNYNTGKVTFNSPILANGSNAVTVKGTGTTVFAGVNTFTGVATVRGGTLELASGGSITSGNNVIVGDVSGENGTFNLTGGTVSNFATYFGNSAGSSGTVTISGGSWTSSSQFWVGASGTGVLNLTGGSINISGGVLGNSAGGSGTATVSGGNWNDSNSITVGNGGTGVLNITGGTVSSVAGSIGGSGTVAVSSGSWINSSTLYINGVLNISGGTVRNTTGTLGLSAGQSGTVTVSSGTWTNTSSIEVGLSGTGVLNITGGTVSSSTSSFVGENSGSSGTVTMTSGSWINSSNLVIGGSGTGVLNISGGTVSSAGGSVGNSTGSSGTVTVSGGAWNNSTGVTVGGSGAGGLSITDSGVFTVAGTMTLGNSSGSSGTLNLGIGGVAGTLRATTITSGSGAAVVNFNHTGSLALAANLTGSLVVNKLGGGTTVLSGTNTYTGATTISGGTLQIGAGSTTGALATSSAITNNGTLAFNRSDTVTQGTHFASVISGSGGVTQMGTGILNLAGVNAYTGATTVTGGLLKVNGTTTAASVVGVSGGALGGTGTVGGAVTLSNSGGIKLTDGVVGTLTLNSTLAITGAAGANNLFFDLGAAAAGTDKLVVGGATSVTNAGAAVITLNQLGGVATRINAGTYTLIQGTTSMAAVGQFALATTAAFGQTFTLGLSGNNLQVTTTAANAGPAVAFWQGSGGTNWSMAGNWNSTVAGGVAAGAVPGYQSNVTFATTTPVATNLTTNVVDADFDINSLTFNGAAGGVTVGGTKLLALEATNANGNTAGNGITSSNSSGTNAITVKVGLAASQTWTVAAGGTLAVSGVVSDFSGGYSLTKDGTGTLILSGANTYSGNTTVTAGVLNIRHANALGSTTAGTSVSVIAGAALQLQGGITTLVEALTLNGSGIGSTGALRNLSDDNVYSGLITLGSATRINSDTGTLILSHSGTITGATFGLTVSGAGNTTINSIIGTTSGTLTKDGTGTLTLSGASTYTGATSVNGGTLRTGVSNALGSNSAVTLANVADVTLDLNGFNTQIGNLSGGGASGGNVTLGGATLTVGGTTTSQPFAGVISGGALIRSGSGTLILTGANTYTGATTISGGTLQLGNGGTTGSLSASSAISNDGTLVFNRSNTLTQGTDFASVISGNGSVRQNGPGTLTLSGANTYTNITAVNGGTLVLAFGTLTSNIIASSSTLTLGGGTLQLTGTGTQTVNGLTTTTSTGSKILLGAGQTLTLGTLSAGGSSALNFNNATGGANASTVTVGTGIVVLSGQTAGTAINAGFTVTDAGGFGLATVNGSNQVVRLTTTSMLPASGATSANNYRIDNNNGGAAAAGSAALNITISEAALSLTVDTSTASGMVTLSSSAVLSTNTWNFGGSGTNTWQISGSTSGAGLKAVASGNAIEINNYNSGTVTFSSPILAFGTNAVNLKGTGTTVFAGVNTHTGVTTIHGGTLEVASGGSIGSVTAAAMNVGSTSGDNGTLNITGGTVSDTTGTLGTNTGSSGTATVSSGTWANSNMLIIGSSGTGVLNLTGGTISGTNGGTLGVNAGSSGTATVSGGTWTNSNTLIVGNSGIGVLNITGGSISGTIGTLGGSAGGSGTATVSSGSWTNSGNFFVASSGTGVLNVTGGTVSNVNGTVGSTDTGSGTAAVSSGSWTNSGTLTVGNSGTGVLNISGTGTVSNTSGTLGSNAGSSGTATVSSGTWSNSVNLFVGVSGTGVLNINGGTVSNTTGQIGQVAGSSGTVTVSGGTWTNFGGLLVGNNGTGALNITGGAVSNTNGTIGSGAGSGTVTVSSGSWTNSGSLNIGASGTGVLNVTGGTVSNTSGALGASVGGSGTVTVSSGTWTNSSTLDVGYNTNSIGVLTVSGSGVVNVGGVDGTGTLTLGNAGAGTLNLGSGGVAGTLNAATVNGGSGTAVVNFNQTGNYTFAPSLTGSLTVNKLGSGTTTFANANTYSGITSVSDGQLHVGASLISTSAVNVGEAAGTLGTYSSATNSFTSQNAALLSGNNSTSMGSVTSTVTIGSGGVGILSPGGSLGSNNGTLMINHDLVVSSGSMIELGITTPTTAAVITFANGVYTFNSTNYNTAGDLFNPDFGGAGANSVNADLAASTWNVLPSSSSNHDYISVTNALTLNNSSKVHVVANGSLTYNKGQVFNLIDWATLTNNGFTNPTGFTSGGIWGDFYLPDLSSTSLAWDTGAFLSHGILVVVPEPSRMTLLMLSLFGLFFRRRRNRSL